MNTTELHFRWGHSPGTGRGVPPPEDGHHWPLDAEGPSRGPRQRSAREGRAEITAQTLSLPAQRHPICPTSLLHTDNLRLGGDGYSHPRAGGREGEGVMFWGTLRARPCQEPSCGFREKLGVSRSPPSLPCICPLPPPLQTSGQRRFHGTHRAGSRPAHPDAGNV